LRVTPPESPPTALGDAPRLISEDFSTLYETAGLLLDEVATTQAWRFSATLRLTTAPGHVGHVRTEVVARGQRLPDATLDRQMEVLLLSGPLPPLTGGSALCEVVIGLTPGANNVLNVWVGKPHHPLAEGPPPRSLGWLEQQPLGLPAAVLASSYAAAARDRWRQNRRFAKTALLTRLLTPDAPPLYGTWRDSAGPAWNMTQEALRAAPAGDAEPLWFLGALTLAADRRYAEAQQWAEMAAASSADRELAAQARWLAFSWTRRNGGRPEVKAASGANEAPWAIETAAARAAAGRGPEELSVCLERLRWLDASPNAGARDLLWRQFVGDAAEALAATAVKLSIVEEAAFLQSFSEEDPPGADWILLDAGLILRAQKRPAAGIEAFRALLAEYPLSPLAPEAGWRLAQAALETGDAELAKAAAWRTVREFVADSIWSEARREAEETPDWLAAGAPAPRTAIEVRRAALRFLRARQLADFLAGGDRTELAEAETAARMLIDELPAAAARADWLALGDVLFAGGQLPQAAAAYGNVALAVEDDEVRGRALAFLAASLTPDARRVAAALRDDPLYGPMLAALRQ
jgi:hypothetical protein